MDRLKLPARVGAAASFHGGRFLVEPEAPDAIAANVRAPIYIGVSEIDRRHTPEISARLEAALVRAGVPHRLEVYAGASHGFAVADLPVYDRAASERHWEQLLTFFGDALGAR